MLLIGDSPKYSCFCEMSSRLCRHGSPLGSFNNATAVETREVMMQMFKDYDRYSEYYEVYTTGVSVSHPWAVSLT